MAEYKLTREERETQLLTNEAADSWDFWTSSARWARKVERLGYPVKKDHQGGWSCKIPLHRITIRSAEASKRRISPASLAALARSRIEPKSADTDQGSASEHRPAMVRQGGSQIRPEKRL